MKPTNPSPASAARHWAALDDFVAAYESAHARSGQADIAAFLPKPQHPLYWDVLRELVRVDLEYAWRGDHPRRLEDYQRDFPQLFQRPDALKAIAFEEYRLRRLAGEEVSPAEYQERFGVATDQWAQLSRPSPGPESDAGRAAANRDELAKSRTGPAQPTLSPQGGGQGEEGPQVGLSEVARAYLEFRLRHPVTDGRGLDSWCDSLGGIESARFFRDVHRSDPQTASRLAQAVKSLPEAGTDFLGFRLLAELGRGAFARVYLAQQADLANRPVALKVSADTFGESQRLAQLQHTNIVPIYSIHRAPPLQAVCMPYFGATTLADVLAQLERSGSLPESGKVLVSTLNDRKVATRQCVACLPGPARRGLPPTTAGRASMAPSGSKGSRDEPVGSGIQVSNGAPAGAPEAPAGAQATVTLKMLEGLTFVEAVLWLTTRLADGLAHAHERGILHRDLKPANVLLTDEGQPMLLDFNLSADVKFRSSAAAASIGGTLPYMSPEHVEAFRGGSGRVDERSDLYALGIILFELLTGKNPFPAYGGADESVLARMIADRLRPPPRFRRRNPAVSPAVESIVRHCLEPDPAKRYQSARELQEDLDRHLRHLPLKHAPEPSLPERARKALRRHPRLVSTTSVAAIAAAVLVVLATAFVLRGRHLARLEACGCLRSFQEEARQAQFLLYARGGDRDNLEQGTAAGRAALDRYQVLANPAWRELPLFRDLPGEDQAHLQQDVSELLFLLARAAFLQADYQKDSSKRDARIQLALELNRLAELQGGAAMPKALWTQRARLAEALGDADQARRLREQARQAPAQNARDQFLIAHEYAIDGNFRRALPLLQEVTQRDPQNFSAWFVQGNCHDALAQEADALACFSVCVSLRPEFHWAWFNRGLVHLKLRNYQRAGADFDQALVLRPGLADAYVNRALAKEGMNQYAAAVEDLTQALDHGTSSTRVYFMRAYARERAGDAEGAKRNREEGMRREPADDKSWVARGIARLTRDPQGALDDFDRALALNARSLEAMQNKAHVLGERLGRRDDAIRVLDEAIRQYPDSVAARAGRGVLLARAGKRAAAEQDAREALLHDTRPPNLYQVACIYALNSRQNPDDRLQAFELLSSALRRGFGLDLVDKDSDLDPIRSHAEFRRLLDAARALRTGGDAKGTAKPAK